MILRGQKERGKQVFETMTDRGEKKDIYYNVFNYA